MRVPRPLQLKSNAPAGRFTCRFHGWTFDSAGRAIGIPEEHQFCGEIGAQKHLVALPAEERYGLVFVQLTPGSTMDLDTHFGQLARDFAAIGLETAEIVHADDLPVDANWKYGLDTFFETYHLNSLHRETFEGLFSPVCVFDTFGPHHRYTFAPLNLPEWVTTPESEWQVDTIPLLFTEGVNKGRIDLATLARALAENPARIFGIYPQKGVLAPGSDADIVVIDQDQRATLGVRRMRGRADYSNWEGKDVKGMPVMTFLRGTLIAEDGEVVARPGGRHVVGMAPRGLA